MQSRRPDQASRPAPIAGSRHGRSALARLLFSASATLALAGCASLPPPSSPATSSAIRPEVSTTLALRTATPPTARPASYRPPQPADRSHGRVLDGDLWRDPARILNGDSIDFGTLPDAGPEPADLGTSDLATHAMSYLGVRYRMGGTSPETGFDCSGLVHYVTREVLGLHLPRRAEDMSRASMPIDTADLQPGDLVFYNTLRRKYSHVGIYLGDGRFVHAPSSGGVVRVERMNMAYWKKRFNGARRIAANEVAAR